METHEHHNVSHGEQRSGTDSRSPLGRFNPLGVLVRRRWQLLACLLLVCSVAFATTMLRRPKYEAVARVQVVMDTPKIGGMAAAMGGFSKDYFSTQCQLLHSRHVLARAADKLNMAGGHWVYSEEGMKALRNCVQIKPLPGSRLIDIVGVGETGTKAAAIANQVTAAFIETSTEARQATNARMATRVESQIQNYDEEIGAREEALLAFRREHQITGQDSMMLAVERRINQLEEKLTQAQMRRLDLAAKRSVLEKALRSGEGVSDGPAALPELRSDPTLAKLRNKIEALGQQETELAQAYLAGHHKLVAVRGNLADLRAKLAEQKSHLTQSLFEQTGKAYDAVAKDEESVKSVLAEQRVLGVKLTQRHQEYKMMLAELEAAQRFRAECIAKVRDFTLKEGIAESPVVVLDPAHVPTRAAGLSKSHQAGSILLLGLVFSLGFVFAVERLSTDAPAGASAMMGGYMPGPMGQQVAMWPMGYWPQSAGGGGMSPSMPQSEAPSPTEAMVLGSVGPMELGGANEGDRAFAARCRLAQTDQSSSQASSFRSISSKLLSRFGQTPQSVVITSEARQSGKTTCACNLGLLLAQAGRRVLLVEGNAGAPSLSRVFEMDGEGADLSSVMAGTSTAEEAIRETDVTNVSVLGARPEAMQETAWDTETLVQLHQALQGRFDWVLYDADVVASSLSEMLLGVVGRSLCVASGSNTAGLSTAIAAIEHSGAVNIGVILNQAGVDQPVGPLV